MEINRDGVAADVRKGSGRCRRNSRPNPDEPVKHRKASCPRRPAAISVGPQIVLQTLNALLDSSVSALQETTAPDPVCTGSGHEKPLRGGCLPGRHRCGMVRMARRVSTIQDLSLSSDEFNPIRRSP